MLVAAGLAAQTQMGAKSMVTVDGMFTANRPSSLFPPVE
jgi:hypothetical protein